MCGDLVTGFVLQRIICYADDSWSTKYYTCSLRNDMEITGLDVKDSRLSELTCFFLAAMPVEMVPYA